MSQGGLNHLSFEKIIQNVIKNEGKPVNINLEEFNFIDPYGLVGLVSIARYGRSKNTPINFTLPGYNMRTYMERMNLFSTISKYLYGFDPGFLLNFKRNIKPLLEITRVDLNRNENQIVTLTELLNERMNMMFNNHPFAGSPILYQVIISIIEICQNLVHSGDIGYVAAQKYDNPFSVKIGLMDLGKGISKSLKSRYQKKGEEWSDKKALELAIQPDVSSRPSGGGFGLSRLTQFVLNQPHSELMIRSGAAKCIVKNGRINIEQGFPLFPGTQISINIKL